MEIHPDLPTDLASQLGLAIGNLGPCETLRLCYADSGQSGVLIARVKARLKEKDSLSDSGKKQVISVATALIAHPVDPSIDHITSSSERERADIAWLQAFDQRLKRIGLPPVHEKALRAQAEALVERNEAENPGLAKQNTANRRLKRDLGQMGGGKSRRRRKLGGVPAVQTSVAPA